MGKIFGDFGGHLHPEVTNKWGFNVKFGRILCFNVKFGGILSFNEKFGRNLGLFMLGPPKNWPNFGGYFYEKWGKLFGANTRWSPLPLCALSKLCRAS